MTSEKRIKAAWLFPDTLFLHGNRGNHLALKRICETAGFELLIDKVDFDTENFDPTAYDFIFSGPGEIKTFKSIIDYLKPQKDLFKATIAEGNPMLITGTSVAMWGSKITRCDGTVIEGLNIVDFESQENEKVYGDDLIFNPHLPECHYPILGNQIQMIDVQLGKTAKPFGDLLYGYGNSGKNTTEGALLNKAVFTNTLGPILVLNPWLGEAFVRIIAKKRGLTFSKNYSLDTEWEALSFRQKVKYNADKVTHLTNCPHFREDLNALL